MAQPEWRGVLNQILYVANRYPFTDEFVDRIAVDMIGRFQLWCGPDVYHQAISEALQSGTALGPPTLRTEHDDTALRDFFRRLRDRLDSGRPWPDARFVRLSTDDWPTFADAPKIATIELTFGRGCRHAPGRSSTRSGTWHQCTRRCWYVCVLARRLPSSARMITTFADGERSPCTCSTESPPQPSHRSASCAIWPRNKSRRHRGRSSSRKHRPAPLALRRRSQRTRS